jgi:hypothetical protein
MVVNTSDAIHGLSRSHCKQGVRYHNTTCHIRKVWIALNAAEM